MYYDILVVIFLKQIRKQAVLSSISEDLDRPFADHFLCKFVLVVSPKCIRLRLRNRGQPDGVFCFLVGLLHLRQRKQNHPVLVHSIMLVVCSPLGADLSLLDMAVFQLVFQSVATELEVQDNHSCVHLYVFLPFHDQHHNQECELQEHRGLGLRLNRFDTSLWGL